MADDITKPAAESGGEDRLGNLQAEFNRKFENQQKELKTLADTNAALSQQLKAVAPKPAPKEAAEEPLDVIFYKDPNKHAQIVKEQAKKELREELSRENAAKERMATVINRLGSDYPEFNDAQSDLTKKTVEIYGAMDPSEKADPKALRVAALEAAQELGIKPMSKRSEDEIFSLSNGSGARHNQRRGPSDKLDIRTEDLAAMVGLDYRDPKVAERLKARASRKSYRNYQSNKLVGKK